MYYDIRDFKHLEGYQVELKFDDSWTGIVDFGRYVNRGGVFSRFADMEYFRQAAIESGVLCWPGGVDIAPETLYHEATGEPLPMWMHDEGQGEAA